LTAVIDACVGDAPPDSFAQRAVASCELRISKHADDEIGIQLADMLLYPAIAIQLATSGMQLQLATASSPLVRDRLAERAESLVAALDLVAATRWQPQSKGESSLNAMRGRRELLDELASTACSDYLFLGEPDAALDIMSRVDFVGDAYLKARALADKGLTDAALVAYDDAAREGKERKMQLQFSARYNKAKLLVEIGDLSRARRELARLYADDPTYEDDAGLLDKVKAPTRSGKRVPIPEAVRHAVWRRDEGRCVKCGNQDRLEFDHIIPLSRGGANTERNLQLLCEQCNREKSATI
jgi:tetratricopeptide (TPR) repeat protein